MFSSSDYRTETLLMMMMSNKYVLDDPQHCFRGVRGRDDVASFLEENKEALTSSVADSSYMGTDLSSISSGSSMETDSQVSVTDSGSLSDDSDISVTDSFSVDQPLRPAFVNSLGEMLSTSAADSLSSPSAMSTSRSKVTKSGKGSRVSFNETVKVREFFMEDDDSEVEIEDSEKSLQKGDFSVPVIQPVKFSPEEEEIRSHLVGVLPAEKRIRHDFARMYGCGKSIRSCSPVDVDDDDEDIDKILSSAPVMEIQAHAPSSFWFGGL